MRSSACDAKARTTGSKHPEARNVPAHPTDSSSSLVLPDVRDSAVSSSTGHEHALVDLLKQENDALKRKIASFEQQHRFMMSALDREYHLKVKEQERQRTVLAAELEEVLKQLKFGQFDCKDKVEAAEARVEEERRKTAAAEKLQKQAQQQRNQLVTQVAAMRAELSRRDSQCCFEDLSDLLGHEPDEAPANRNDKGVPPCAPQGADHKIKPFTLVAQRPQTARGASEHAKSSQGLAAVPAGTGSGGTHGLTRDQLGALRKHVKTLATEKLSLLQEVASLRAKWEDAHERAGAAERLAAQLSVVRSEREAALALSSNILAGAFDSCPACSLSSRSRNASGAPRPNAGAHKRPPGAAVKMPSATAPGVVAGGPSVVAVSEAEELRRLREESAALQKEVSMLRQKARGGKDSDLPEHVADAHAGSAAVQPAGGCEDEDALRSQLGEARALLESVRAQLATAVAQKTELEQRLDALGSAATVDDARACVSLTKPPADAAADAEALAREESVPMYDAALENMKGKGAAEAEILHLREALKEKENALAETKARVDTLGEQVQQHKDDASRVGAECARLQQRLDELAQEAEESVLLREEVAYLKAERDELKAASEELLQQVSSVADQGEKRRGEHEQQEMLKMQAVQQEVQAVRDALRERDEKIAKLVEEVGSKERKVKAAEQQLALLQQQEQQIGNGLEEELENMKKKAAEEAKRAGELKQEVEDVKRKAAAAVELAAGRKEELGRLEGVIQDMRQELERGRSEAESAGREAVAAIRKLGEEELEEVKGKLAAAAEQVERLREELEEERRKAGGQGGGGGQWQPSTIASNRWQEIWRRRGITGRGCATIWRRKKAKGCFLLCRC